MDELAAKIDVDGIAIHVRQWGTGTPLVMVHGLGGDSCLWREQIAAFSVSHRMVAIDLRGFGESDKPPQKDGYDIDSLTRDVASVVDQLGLQQCHFLGTSMGGFIGLTLALSRPELCRSLVLCHTAAHMGIPVDILRTRLNALAQTSMQEYAQLVAAQAMDPAASQRLHSEVVDTIAKNDKWAYTQVLSTGLANFDLRAHVGDIKVPALVLVGASDRVIPPQLGADLAGRIDGAQLVTIGQAGHLSYLERPQAFNNAVLDFLAGV